MPDYAAACVPCRLQRLLSVRMSWSRRRFLDERQVIKLRRMLGMLAFHLDAAGSPFLGIDTVHEIA